MKNNFYAINLIIPAILALILSAETRAQSNDIDNPTVLTANVVVGEGDGKAETVYYSFTAAKGDVKITVDAKTDDRSTPLRVALLDADGKELLPIYVVAKGAGAREVGTKRFVRDTKVILKIRMDDDKDVKLLTYKIKLDGAVKFEEPPPTEKPADTPPTPNDATTTSTGSAPVTESNSGGKKEKTPDKIKKKVKAKTKETVKEIIDN